MDLENLTHQNQQLNEQIKLLVQTEKKLVRIQQQNDNRIRQMKEVSAFALKSSGSFNCEEILSNAIQLFCSAYPFHSGEAIYINDIDKTAHLLVKKNSEKVVTLGAEPAQWKARLQENSIDNLHGIKVFANSESLNPPPAFLEHLSETFAHATLTENLRKTPSIILSLTDSKKVPCGFIHVFQETNQPTSYHLKAPTEADLPFLAFCKSHIEAALENASLHVALEEGKNELEKRVEQRTSELASTNHMLTTSMERLHETQAQLIDISRQIGMSEVATGVLHNVGNVLNSVNVSAILVTELTRKLKVEAIQKVADLLNENKSNISDYVTNDALGKKLIEYFKDLTGHFATDKAAMLQEMTTLASHIDHVKAVISTQQNYAKVGGVKERFPLSDLVNDALNLSFPEDQRTNISLVCKFDNIEPCWTDRHKVLQILVNLITNARHALADKGGEEKLIEIGVSLANANSSRIVVRDNGVGVEKANLLKIFAQGFSTRKNGHGFGLHNCAVAAQDLGGQLWCESEGVGCGASFILELPFITSMDNHIPLLQGAA